MLPLVLSLVVYPGSGHLLLKRWLRALIWIAAFSLPMLPIVWFVGSNMSKYTDILMSPTGDVPPIDMHQVGVSAACAFVSFLAYLGAAADCWWLASRRPTAEVPVGLTPPAPAPPATDTPV